MVEKSSLNHFSIHSDVGGEDNAMAINLKFLLFHPGLLNQEDSSIHRSFSNEAMRLYSGESGKKRKMNLIISKN